MAKSSSTIVNHKSATLPTKFLSQNKPKPL